jgi:hypothetical protein
MTNDHCFFEALCALRVFAVAFELRAAIFARASSCLKIFGLDVLS